MNALLPDGWVSLYLLKRSENRYSNKRASWWLSNKESTWNTGATEDVGSIPWSGGSPWRKEWLPTPVFLPGKFHGLRSLAGYSLWGLRVGHDWSDLACTNKNFLKNVRNSNTDNSKKTETTHLSVNQWTDTQNVVYPYNRVLFSYFRKYSTGLYDNIHQT